MKGVCTTSSFYFLNYQGFGCRATVYINAFEAARRKSSTESSFYGRRKSQKGRWSGCGGGYKPHPARCVISSFLFKLLIMHADDSIACSFVLFLSNPTNKRIRTVFSFWSLINSAEVFRKENQILICSFLKTGKWRPVTRSRTTILFSKISPG